MFDIVKEKDEVITGELQKPIQLISKIVAVFVFGYMFGLVFPYLNGGDAPKELVRLILEIFFGLVFIPVLSMFATRWLLYALVALIKVFCIAFKGDSEE